MPYGSCSGVAPAGAAHVARPPKPAASAPTRRSQSVIVEILGWLIGSSLLKICFDLSKSFGLSEKARNGQS
ncbi:hypothetical protein AA13595_3227 [Gluconacetobacter johannae DSM 13595]|nr:hypothetical protein AA13595_3227 [Gluconacetobacter johannae DSM 13595]